MLGHLQLRDLQSLKSSGSRQLRDWVSSAPEAVWEAAAQNTVPAYHPMLRSGDIRHYLAWHAAGEAAWAEGRSWPCSTTTMAPSWFAMHESHVCRRSSHTGEFVATLLPTQHVLELRHKSECLACIRMPVDWQACQPPQFSFDDGAVALLMRGCPSPDPHPDILAKVAVCVISTSTAAVHAIELPELPAIEDYCSHALLTLADYANKLCVSLQSWDQVDCAFWVFSEELVLLADCQGLGGSAQWNASGTGLLLGGGSPLLGSKPYQWLLLPEQAGEAAVISCALHNVPSMRWGAWLPGTGEVMLGVLKTSQTASLACWMPNKASKAWLQLAILLTGHMPQSHGFDETAEWSACLQHVALLDQQGVLRVFRLIPGPQLCLMHNLRIGIYSPSSGGIAISPDGRYLLYLASPVERSCGPVSFLAEICLFVMHISDGAIAKILTMPSEFSQVDRAFWVTGGIRCVSKAQVSIFVQFPSVSARV